MEDFDCSSPIIYGNVCHEWRGNHSLHNVAPLEEALLPCRVIDRVAEDDRISLAAVDVFHNTLWQKRVGVWVTREHGSRKVALDGCAVHGCERATVRPQPGEAGF
jgi:hypothetical protein